MPKKPVVASYVSDFLKADMLHIYRQIMGLKAVEPWVLTHKRENADRFPFPDKRILVLPKPKLRWWRRLVHKHWRKEPWQIYRWELRHMLLDLARLDAQVLHIYFGHIAIHLRPLIQASPRPVVVSFHGADAGVDMEKPAHLAAMRAVFAAAAQIQCRSLSLADDLASLGCPREKIHLQRTGIPLEEWPFAPRNPHPPNGSWRILQSCRLIAKKGVDTTLQAFQKIAAAYPQATLVIAGDGPQKAGLEQLAATLGIAEKVTFTGFLTQENLRREVYLSQLFVHPSRTSADGNREGIPNSLLEAMASGVPVIATHHGGIPEAVTDGESGVLINESDADALAEKALALLAGPQHMAALAHRARGVIETSFDRQINARGLEEAYLGLMAQHRA